MKTALFDREPVYDDTAHALVYGNPADPWVEELVIDESTGQLLLVFAPTEADLDLLADEALMRV